MTSRKKQALSASFILFLLVGLFLSPGATAAPVDSYTISHIHYDLDPATDSIIGLSFTISPDYAGPIDVRFEGGTGTVYSTGGTQPACQMTSPGNVYCHVNEPIEPVTALNFFVPVPPPASGGGTVIIAPSGPFAGPAQGTIWGYALFTDGTVPQGVQVALSNGQLATLGSDGTYRFANLSFDTYTVSLWGDDLSLDSILLNGAPYTGYPVEVTLTTSNPLARVDFFLASSVTVTPPAPGAGPGSGQGTLPRTGGNTWTYSAAGALLIGLALLWRRQRKGA
ncbi:MAG: LPXTG cell wall anchor domain-containing protein [Clostridiales bacterium]|nr:LPXTG cell wall anchor domain-containing protein [Clostridiales bacterium]